jgi:hypothetical protein
MFQSRLSLRERCFYRLKIVVKAGDLSLEFLDFSLVLLRALAIGSRGFSKFRQEVTLLIGGICGLSTRSNLHGLDCIISATCPSCEVVGRLL